MIKTTLEKVQQGETLSEQDMIFCMSSIMAGKWDNEQIAAFLMGMSMRGETVDEITGAARVMRDNALSIQAPENAVDCCGTGGDHSRTYNISTAVAIVSAACGVPVAKHGNRSASSKSGAADVLEALGINLDTSQEKLEEALKKFNFAFLMAPKHHAAMKYVVPVRKSLGVRTIFNVLGPLANPAQTKFQLLGVFDEKLLVPVAQVLQRLGTENAWVVHGEDGLDEITVTGETYVAKLENGEIGEIVLTPEDFGLNTSPLSELKGGDAQENADALLDVLKGKECAYRDIVLANTAGVLMVAGVTNELKQAVVFAKDAIDSGRALNLLRTYRDFTQVN